MNEYQKMMRVMKCLLDAAPHASYCRGNKARLNNETPCARCLWDALQAGKVSQTQQSELREILEKHLKFQARN